MPVTSPSAATFSPSGKPLNPGVVDKAERDFPGDNAVVGVVAGRDEEVLFETFDQREIATLAGHYKAQRESGAPTTVEGKSDQYVITEVSENPQRSDGRPSLRVMGRRLPAQPPA